MNVSIKRVLSFVLALAMVLAMVPAISIAANAATLTGLTDTTIGLTTNNSNGSWSVSGNSISGSVTGGNLGSLWFSKSTTLTITNNKATAAMLSFDYSVSFANSDTGNYVTVAGTKHSGPTAVTATYGPTEIAAGGTITVVINADKNSGGGNNKTSVSITKLSLVTQASGITTTFAPVTGGSYTVNGEAITAETAMVNDSTTSYAMVATVASGYKFVGWYSTAADKYLSFETSLTTQFEADTTVYPVFVTNETAIFLAGGQRYTDLNKAASSGASQVTLISSGAIAPGNYTIPSGVTLLIPKDSGYASQGAKPTAHTGEGSYVTPYVYMTLTVPTGATITVNGTIEASSDHYSCQGHSGRIYGSAPYGPYGAINMAADSNIVLNSGATMYAWGYVYGDGTVTANSGAKVYEYMQITDFCGGNNLSDITQCFPIAQYYIQNIETELVLHYGSEEYIFASVTAASMTFGMATLFISSSNAMFRPASGTTITKDYDPTTDRCSFTVDGDLTLSSITIKLPTGAGLAGLPSSLDSSEYILGLNGNMSLYANSGKITIAQDISVMPGAEIYVANGATLHVASGDSSGLTVSGSSAGHNVYVYDAAEWGTYIFSSRKLTPAPYSPTPGRYVRTAADLKDVIIDINGTVTTDGFVYTTAGGAAVISSQGTGKIVMNNGAGTETAMLQLNGTGNSKKQIAVTSAKLLNADGTYTETAGAVAGDTFIYKNGKWAKVTDATITFNANGGAGNMASQTVTAADILAGNTSVMLSGNTVLGDCSL